MNLKKEFKKAILIYLITWVLFFVGIVLLLFFRSNESLLKSITRFFELAAYLDFLISVHILFVSIYILFVLIRYFFRVYKKRGLSTSLKQIGFRVLFPLLVLIVSYKIIDYNNNNERYEYTWDYSVENTSGTSKNLYAIDGKHRGMHVFGFEGTNEKGISDIVKTNIEWVAIVPFIHQKNEYSNPKSAPDKVGSWTRRDSSFIKMIHQFQEKGIKIMLKPHLWLSDGWRSNINFASDKEWDTWFESYRLHMIHYAQLAEQNNVELLCIGTELRTSIKHQPLAWQGLIRDIKKVYSGKLTYAANWDDDIASYTFWEALDYVGVQAYFPLTKNNNPDLETIKRGWNPFVLELETLSKKLNKPVLFTEVGYKSEAAATVTPWEWNSIFSNLSRKKSNKTQQLAYEALFQSLWDKEWFAGIYVWQWSFRSQEENAPKNLDFSPRFKPAENTIATWFEKLVYDQ
ncbi:glycoside hydrolase family 113 [Rasiella sp. SM2506]|uniref:glycoside hydrolase family 113 n=1 Tax=Rasiella sp. SM2506 TaxID=3423914 RepID=UPI003D7A584E